MGSWKPASRSGSSSISVPNGSSQSRISCALGSRGAVVGWIGRSPLTIEKASRSWTSGWASGCRATAGLPVRPAQHRRATCCAIVPVGKNAAASRPSSSATRCSSTATMPSPYMSGGTSRSCAAAPSATRRSSRSRISGRLPLDSTRSHARTAARRVVFSSSIG
ncbi:hypothetical protein M2266_004042 [Streptomyces sp. SPB162]|nr:hypothetical protein [Streptomyces sp. SPB162]